MTKLERLNAFFAAREEAGDWRDYLNKAATQISRQAVVESCKFPRSTLYQVAAVQIRLADMDAELRQRGIVTSPGTGRSQAIPLHADVIQHIDALTTRLDTLLGQIAEVRGLITSFDVEEPSTL